MIRKEREEIWQEMIRLKFLTYFKNTTKQFFLTDFNEYKNFFQCKVWYSNKKSKIQLSLKYRFIQIVCSMKFRNRRYFSVVLRPFNLPLFLRIILIFQGLLRKVKARKSYFLRIIVHFLVICFTFSRCNFWLHNFGPN